MNDVERQSGERTVLRTPPTREAPGAARRFVEDSLGTDERLDSVRLVASELVTNAVLHGGAGQVTVALAFGDTIRLQVHQADHPGFEPPDQRPDSMDSSGRGLLIVDAIATSWGVDRRTGAVWADFT